MPDGYTEIGTEGNSWVVNDPARQWWRWENETTLHEVAGARTFATLQDAIDATGPAFVHIRRATSSTGTGTGTGNATPPATTPATTDGITGLPLVGPIIGSLSNATGLPPIAVAAVAALAAAWMLGMFESGGRKR